MRQKPRQLPSLDRWPPLARRVALFGTVTAAIALVAWLQAVGAQPAAVFLAGAGGILAARLLALWPPAWTRPASLILLVLTVGDWAFVAANRDRKPPAPPHPSAIAAEHRESCLTCHASMTGFSSYHRPENIGCAICHKGNPRATDAVLAHAGMVLIPGNLADAAQTCGTAGCHDTIVPRVEKSIMTTFAGVIDTDRRVFGEKVDPHAPPPHVKDLGHSAADTHLRQLCASCHLGQSKEDWGPIVQESRGGGCNACHLNYSTEAAHELARYRATPKAERQAVPHIHPSLDLNISNGHCFGCHSRSGRISTSYEGWNELREPPPPAKLAQDSPTAPKYRQLDDGRYFERVVPDIHHDRGMDCMDCHTAGEVMGSGSTVAHKRDQQQIRCEDCHATQLATQPIDQLDAESNLIASVRHWRFQPGERVGVTRDGHPLVNVVVDANGHGQLRRKRTNEVLPLKAPLPVCTAGGGHDRLSCSSCHTAWTPRCTSCHTSYEPDTPGFDHLRQVDTKGTWIEKSGAFSAMPPTLGIRRDAHDSAHPQGIVDTFMPGMILTIDRNRDPHGKPDLIFRRLYGLTSAHTTRREARSCQSCHNDPVALGYGEGTLVYQIKAGQGHWHFTPKHAALPEDGLPADAWTGFLQNRSGMVSTRDDVRPFNVAEQRRILTAGACLTCHAGDSPVMTAGIKDFAGTVARRSSQCVLPDWPMAASTP